jgi:hypothetical protein
MAGAIVQFQDRSVRMNNVLVAAILRETVLEGLGSDSAILLQDWTAKEEQIVEFRAWRKVQSGIGPDQISFANVVSSENICRH